MWGGCKGEDGCLAFLGHFGEFEGNVVDAAAEVAFEEEKGKFFRVARYTNPVVRFSLHKMRVEGVCIDELDGLSRWRLLRSSRGTMRAYATAHEAFSAIWKTAAAGNNKNLVGGTDLVLSQRFAREFCEADSAIRMNREKGTGNTIDRSDFPLWYEIRLLLLGRKDVRESALEALQDPELKDPAAATKDSESSPIWGYYDRRRTMMSWRSRLFTSKARLHRTGARFDPAPR